MSPFNPATLPSSGPFSTVDKSLTAAQIKALAASHITVLAAPGAGYITHAVGVFLYYTFVTAEYVDPGTANPQLSMGGYTLYNLPVAIFTNTVSGMWSWGAPYLGFRPLDSFPMSEPISNLPIVVENTGANLTTGDATVKIRLYYQTLAVV